MNRHIRFLGVGLLVCFVALFVQLNRLQVTSQEELQANPLNTRQVVRDFGQPRGNIFTADGTVVATSVEVEDPLERERTYPEGELYGHLTGYFSFQFGADGLERQYNDLLAGQTDEQRYGSILDLFADDDDTANLTMTVRDDVQRVARDALGERLGSVVVLDPRTGDVLAMWSYPSFDPTVLGSTDLAAAEAAWRGWEASAPGTDPRLAKAYRENYFPGSTFKVVTAAAALDQGVATLAQPVFDTQTSYVAPLTTVELRNFGGGTCGGNLLEILRNSCNTAFAQLAAEFLGPSPMIETAEDFGFNEAPPLDLPAIAPSVFPTDFGVQVDRTDREPSVPIVENTPALAQSGIGQNDVKATPLEMALVAAAVANDGIIMAPHLMAELRDQNGELVESYSPRVWKAAIAGATAAELRAAMIDTAARGTATAMQIDGVVVGAKTGTAQLDAERPDVTNAWMIAFAGPEGGEPTAVVAVIVEHREGDAQLTGGRDAAPVARRVLEAALRAQGVLPT